MLLQIIAAALICFTDNAREAITENRSARLDESDSIQKKEQRTQNICVYCGICITIRTYFLLLRAQKYRPPLGVWQYCELLQTDCYNGVLVFGGIFKLTNDIGILVIPRIYD